MTDARIVSVPTSVFCASRRRFSIARRARHEREQADEEDRDRAAGREANRTRFTRRLTAHLRAREVDRDDEDRTCRDERQIFGAHVVVASRCIRRPKIADLQGVAHGIVRALGIDRIDGRAVVLVQSHADDVLEAFGFRLDARERL